MIKKRENYKFVILEPAKTRLEKDLCPSCAKPKAEWKRSKTWHCCSKECTAKFQKDFTYSGWPDLRNKAFKRDKYRCVKCKLINYEKHICTNGIYKTGKEYIEGVLQYPNQYINPIVISDNPPTIKCIDKSKLIGDHILAIANGGEEWDINNVQTLCEPCHKIKTKEDMKGVVSLRKKQKYLAKTEKHLPLESFTK